MIDNVSPYASRKLDMRGVKILYGVGAKAWATRCARVWFGHLVAEGHEIEIMASGRAVDFLSKRFEGVNRIHGLHGSTREPRPQRQDAVEQRATGSTGIPKHRHHFELLRAFGPRS